MKRGGFSTNRPRWGFSLALRLVLAWAVSAQAGPAASPGLVRFPADGATGVNPDTHLVITFPSAPTLGHAGKSVSSMRRTTRWSTRWT